MFGRVTNVQERKFGSVLSADTVQRGVQSIIGDLVDDASSATSVITLTADAVGDGCVIAGANQAGFVPNAAVDSRGNTYHLENRANHGGGGVDWLHTNGLDGTLWILHGDYDVAKLVAGDTITLTYSGSPAHRVVAVLDVQGIAYSAVPDDYPARDEGQSIFSSFTMGSGKTIAANDTLYIALAYGGGSTASGGTQQYTNVVNSHNFYFLADVVPAGSAPVISVSAGGWVEGLTYAYALNPSEVDGTVFIADPADFDTDGSIIIDPAGFADAYTYEVVDEATGEMTLEPALVRVYPEGTEVRIFPVSHERTAWLVAGDDEGNEEGMAARVPHALYDKIPVGIRDWTLGEGETVTAAYHSDELVIVEVQGRAPVVDGSFIDSTSTMPGWSAGGDLTGSFPAPTLGAGVVDADEVAASLKPSGTAATTDEALRALGTTPGTAAAGDDARLGDARAPTGSASGDLTGTYPAPTIKSNVALSGNVTAGTLSATGLTGATAASRYVGATTSGAPVSGTFLVGDFIIDRSGSVWVCTVAGTPGTWVAPSGGGGSSSDGSPPSTSPAATVRGALGLLIVNWTAVTNADPTAYELHISTTTGFTPGPTTLYGKFLTTAAAVRTLADGTALAYGTTYFVKLIAFDDDGSASAGTQGSGTLTQIVNADIGAGAAIVYSKLNLSASIVNADVASGAGITYAKLTLTGAIINADISSSAAIAYSKLALSGSIVNADVASGAGIVYSKLTLTGSIINADVNASAAIAYSKLALAGSIVNADISASAAIAYSKLTLTGAVTNADLAGSIAATKISGTALVLNAANTLTSGGSLVSGTSGLTAAWNLGVDGTFLLPRLTVAQRLTAAKGQIEWNEDRGAVEVYNGSVYLPVVDTGPDAVDAALGELGATALPIAFTMDPASFDGTVTTGAPALGLTQSRLVGGAFIVTRARTAVSLRVRVLVAGTGTANYSGMGLFSMNSSGNWTFLGDTGANDGTIFNGTGNQTRNLRNAADNADLAVSLVPGVVYFAALICGLTGVTVSGVANSLVNGGEATYFRCGGRNTLTTRATAFANQTAVNLQSFTNLPLIVVSGS